MGGACYAAAIFAERLLMEWGSGDMEVGWSRVPIEDVPKLFLLEMWHFFNWFAPAEVHKYYGASMHRAVLKNLTEHRGGTTVYVGHDSDIMMLKGALDLTWDPEPYARNATLPGSMLRFVRDGDQVTASYIYVHNFSNANGHMQSVDARFVSSSSANLPVPAFVELLKAGSIEECANAASAPAFSEVVV